MEKRTLIKEEEYSRSYVFSFNGRRYHVSETSLRANRRTTVLLDDASIRWVQTYSNMTMLGYPVTTVIGRTVDFMLTDHCNILLIRGELRTLCGLDEGLIGSLTSLTERETTHLLYVMSEKSFIKYLR